VRKSTGLMLGAGIAALAVAAGWIFWPLASAGRADADDARQVALGTVVYRDHCASCHGANLEGQPDWKSRKPDGRLPAPPHDETGHTWHHPDDMLFQITKLGLKPPMAPAGYQSDMPAFGAALTDEQIWAVLAYIKSKWPKQIQARQSSFNKGGSK
jgi:mono/diheme cytochrome c family protein